MARLIDADALPKYTGYALSADEVAMAVENAPTIDAVPREDYEALERHFVNWVPVVRCKDCVYYQDNNNGYPHDGCRWRSDETPDADDFCSMAERKEMSDYIKREDAIKRFEALADSLDTFEFRMAAQSAANELRKMPSTCFAPVRHGHWIKINPAGIYECSECGKNVMTSDIEAYEYCHGCGARMDGESDD